MLKNLFFILSFFYLSVGLAQDVEQQTDSLLNVIAHTRYDSIKVEAYIELAQLNLYTQPHKTVEYCEKHINLCESIGDYTFPTQAYTLIFNAQYYYGAPADSLLLTIQRYENHVKSYLSDEYLLNVYWIYGLYYNNLSQSDKAIEGYIKALEIAQEYKYGGEVKGALVSNIGGILLDQGELEEARDYF